MEREEGDTQRGQPDETGMPAEDERHDARERQEAEQGDPHESRADVAFRATPRQTLHGNGGGLMEEEARERGDDEEPQVGVGPARGRDTDQERPDPPRPHPVLGGDHVALAEEALMRGGGASRVARRSHGGGC